MTSEVSRIYGPHREVTWQRYKEACTKDSVREALNNGEHGGGKELVWITSTKESYQVSLWFYSLIFHLELTG